MNCIFCGKEIPTSYSADGFVETICKTCANDLNEDANREMFSDDAEYLELAGLDDIGCK